MQLAIDSYYREDGTAKCVGVLFNWNDHSIIKHHEVELPETEPYESGAFYKRELPGILELLKTVDLSAVDHIVLDSHVFLNQGKKGLGAYLYEKLNPKIPVIGVAKRAFHMNDEYVIPITRGESNNALYVSAIGVETKAASNHIKMMQGSYRIPSILKEVDRLSRL